MPSLHTNQRQAHRKPPLILRWLRFSFRIQSRLSTSWAARRAYRFWFIAPRYPEPPREKAWREQARQSMLDHPHGPLAIYQWGEGQETILMLHGWSGRGSQMGAFAGPLVDAGYRVVALDAPGHGQSHGKSTTLFEISDALFAVAGQYGPVKAVIAHSFGAFVLAYTLKHTDLRIEKAVCISTPSEGMFLLNSFCHALRLNEAVKQKFLHFFEVDFGEDIWTRLSSENNTRQLDVPALILHDKDDTDVPWQLSEKLAGYWPNARLHLTEGLGHRRILRNQQVIGIVRDFIA